MASLNIVALASLRRYQRYRLCERHSRWQPCWSRTSGRRSNTECWWSAILTDSVFCRQSRSASCTADSALTCFEQSATNRCHAEDAGCNLFLDAMDASIQVVEQVGRMAMYTFGLMQVNNTSRSLRKSCTLWSLQRCRRVSLDLGRAGVVQIHLSQYLQCSSRSMTGIPWWHATYVQL